MKIVFLNSTLDTGGREKMLCETVTRLRKRAFDVKVYCLYKRGRIGSIIASSGISVRDAFLRNKFDLGGILKMFISLKRELPDVICIESSPLVLFWGFLAGRFSGSKVVTVVHSMKAPEIWRRLKGRIINRLVLHRLDRIGVVSVSGLNLLIREYALNPSRLWLINNAISPDEVCQSSRNEDAIRDYLGIKRGEKTVGMVGRLVKEKAYDVFLKSAALILKDMPDVRFIIIGSGDEFEVLKTMACSLGIEDRIIFTGERSDAGEMIKIFDVAVLSSRIESFPVVLLEYMACRKPIVATDTGDVSRILRDGETGLIVRPEDPQGLADAVLNILSNPFIYREMGEKAYRDLVNRFNIEDMINEMTSFLKDWPHTRHKPAVIMLGPGLNVKGGVSSFAKTVLFSDIKRHVFISYLPTTIDGNKLLKIFFYIKSVVCFIFKLAADRHLKVAHICVSSRGSFYRKAILLFITRLMRRRVILHIHGSSFHVFYETAHILRRFLIKIALDKADLIIVLSEWWRRAVQKMTRNFNIKAIPNPVDVGLADSYFVESKDYSGLDILTLGRIGRRKGTYDIIEVVGDMSRRFPGARFYIAGDGEVNKVKDVIRQKGLDRNMILPGWLDREETFKALRKATVFLLPSYYEGFPMAVLEAMASGLPVIGTDVGGMRELVREGYNGFLLSPGDLTGFKGKLAFMFENAEARKVMGRNSFNVVRKNFDIKIVYKRFLDEYNNLFFKSVCDGRKKRMAWYINRLLSMSFPEIFYRVYLSTRTFIRRYTLPLYEKRYRDNLDDILHKATPKERSFYFEWPALGEAGREINSLFPEEKERLIRRANDICAHRFNLLGLDIRYGPDIDWHVDPFSMKRWPLAFSADIDYRHVDGLGESRLVWELNRHQHLVTLASAFVISGDLKYAAEIRNEIVSWINANPLYRGINWTSALEVSIRIISWSWAYRLIETSGVFSHEDVKDFLRYFYYQASFIEENFSRYSSGNNHLIGEACGLLTAAICFPEFKASHRWEKKAAALLFRETLRQVYEDGGLKEQAIHYHGFVMQFLLLAFILLRKNAMDIPHQVMDRFLGMFKFLGDMMDSEGNVPEIGDEDNGMLVPFHETSDLYRSILTAGAVFFNEAGIGHKIARFGIAHYLLFGREGLNVYNSLVDRKEIKRQSLLYSKSGYAILRNSFNNGDERLMVMDCGELGLRPLAAHGHADLLSITLLAHGRRFLVDTGTYLYHRGGVWRDYFRGTAAHNTISVGGKDQAEIRGPFLWGRGPVPHIDMWKPSPDRDVISASYDGNGYNHRRVICFDKNRGLWRVRDIIGLDSEKRVSQYFHFSPDCDVRIIEKNLLEVENKDVFLYVMMDEDLDIELYRASLEPIAGWYSPCFGRKIPCTTVSGSVFTGGNYVIDTILVLSESKSDIQKIREMING